MSNDLMNIEKRGLEIWSKKEQIEQIKQIYGKNLSDGEFQTFVQIGKSTGLNPFLKQIWAVKYGNNPAQIFVARDGYRLSAQSNRDYDYHQVDAVYSNDEYQFDMVKSELHHKYNFKERGSLVGAYALVKKRSSSKPFYVFVEFSEYNTNQSLWKSKPATMIKKVAEAQSLRMAFQELFGGTLHESEEFVKEGKSLSSKTVRADKLNDRFMGKIEDAEIEDAEIEDAEIVDVETGEICIEEIDLPDLASKEQVSLLVSLMADNEIYHELVDKWLNHAKVKTFEEMPSETIEKCINFVKRRIQHAEYLEANKETKA